MSRRLERFEHDPVKAMTLALDWYRTLIILGITEDPQSIKYRLNYIEALFEYKGIFRN